jgi:hypothetical protein
MIFESKMLLDLEAPLQPGEERNYSVHEIGDRYELRDADSGRVILDNVAFETIANYFDARVAADGKP